MIAIFTTNEDNTTNLVVSWLIKYKTEFVRINRNDVLTNIDIDVDNNEIIIKTDSEQLLRFSDISSVWFWRTYEYTLQKYKKFKNYYENEFNECKITFGHWNAAMRPPEGEWASAANHQQQH